MPNAKSWNFDSPPDDGIKTITPGDQVDNRRALNDAYKTMGDDLAKTVKDDQNYMDNHAPQGNFRDNYTIYNHASDSMTTDVINAVVYEAGADIAVGFFGGLLKYLKPSGKSRAWKIGYVILIILIAAASVALLIGGIYFTNKIFKYW